MLERWSNGRKFPWSTGCVVSEDHAARGMHVVPVVCLNDRGVRDLSSGDVLFFVGGRCEWICMLVVINDSSGH
jgi:hypothetical protein